ncbi:nitrate- and nitrite sensing domain-containing protein [Actinomadura hibisca]|uniref:nitrate- and nitrite sensing domain-containing protein n=1 Tax=Actinomadura hibisca TaxID=68565 RepID=UPI00082F7605|nr:nitrate- and nitrite sensing domain-containing protein [Actinomadura hibisca]
MTGRARSVKSKMFLLLVPPITALVALWVFAAATTLTDTLRQTRAQTFTVKVAQPTDAVIAALQDERRMSLSHLGDDATIGRAGFDAQRTKTDQARDAFQRSAADGGIRGATREETRERMNRLAAALGELSTLRAAVDQRKLDRAQALTRFTALVDLAADIYDDVPSDDRRVVRDTRLLISLERAREHLSREDALVTGALAAGRMTEEERLQLIELAGARRFLYDDAARSLSRDDFARYGAIVAGPESKRFQALEGRLTRWPATGGRPPVDIGAWHTATEALGWQLSGLSTGIRATTAHRAEDAAGTFLARLAVTGGLGLLAVVAAIVVAVRVSRRLIRESRTMADTVTVFARDRLPAISEAARRGSRSRTWRPPAPPPARPSGPTAPRPPRPPPPPSTRPSSPSPRSAASTRRSTRPAAPSSAPPPARPPRTAASTTSSSPSPAATSPCCNACCRCWRPCSAAPTAPTSWRRCSRWTTSPPACGGTPRAWSCCRAAPPGAPGATPSGSWTWRAPPPPRSRTTPASRSCRWARPRCTAPPSPTPSTCWPSWSRTPPRSPRPPP